MFSLFGLYCVCVSVYQVFLCITFLLIHVAMSIIGCPTTTIGMGVEYEGGKPGWNDAMNGLPGECSVV